MKVRYLCERGADILAKDEVSSERVLFIYLFIVNVSLF